MDQQTELNIRNIFNNYLNNLQLVDCLINHLDAFCPKKSQILPIKFDNRITYFSVFHEQKKNPVVFAGGIELDDNYERFPVIRFDKHNLALELVTGFTFDYRKKEEEDAKYNTVCVKLRKETIDALPILFWSQLQWFSDSFFQ